MLVIIMGSYYILEIEVSPGGARKDDYYVLNNLEDIKKALEKDFSEQGEIYLLTWYGEDVNLMICKDNAVMKTINLLPFIKVRLDGYPEISFNNDGKLIGFNFEKDDKENEEEDRLSYKLFLNKIKKVEVIIDWNSMKIPKLEGEIIEKGEPVKIYLPRWSEMFELDYGYNNLA